MKPVAVVTGAAGSIGRALVAEFAANNFDVIATDISNEPIGLPCAGYLRADLERSVSDPACAGELLSGIRKFLGIRGITALVNNAAAQIVAPAESLTLADWRKSLDTNLLAPFFLTQGLLQELMKVNGCVVNISSIHAKLTKPEFLAYSTSKAALSALTRALALEFQGRIRVNALEPAAISTNMLRAGFASAPEKLAELDRLHPLGRIGTPEEVARAARWLVVDAPAFMHGSCVGLDGGIGACLLDPSV